MADRILCEVYKGSREEEMYLFVDRSEGLTRVPEALLTRFGKAALVTTITLTAERRLARADARRVLAAIAEQGYYLQLPPGNAAIGDAAMAEMDVRNEKLTR